MAKAYPPSKTASKANAKLKTKGAPKDLGARGRSPRKLATQVSSSVDTTKTGPQTRTTVGKSHKNEGTKGIQKQKAKRTKTKMKANLKKNKPSGVTKTQRLAKGLKSAAKKGSVAGTAVSIAKQGKKAAETARRKAWSKATGKPTSA